MQVVARRVGASDRGVQRDIARFAGAPHVIDPGAEPLEHALEEVPDSPAVFLIHPRAGDPYLGRTALLRRRLKRLFLAGKRPSRLLNLRDVGVRIEYWLAGSRLELALVSYELARAHFPASYREYLKLRLPTYVRLILTNRFPRTQVTNRLAGTSPSYGPFRTRSDAEEFEHALLDLFQLRRCQEDLQPHPGHPGCLYGEMNMCLRPCQEVVTPDEYASEAARVAEFLSTSGKQLIESAAAARNRLSEEMNFEAAARQHKRVERIEQVLQLRGELARDIDRLHGIAVTPSAVSCAVNLWVLHRGAWHAAVPFATGTTADKSVSIDQRLREIFTGFTPLPVRPAERQDHLALLVRWYHSSWRDGEWVGIEDCGRIPFRRIVGAISRVAAGKSG
ncbi:MAG: hypothetical protein HYZ57_14160 [Acidobacteria bacterium]|nr:hypothetical protein [Acidobacteriota bacterium]